MILFATIGGLLTLIAWGASDYFAGKEGQKIDAYLANLIIQFTSTAILLPLVFWYGLPNYSLQSILIIMGISVLVLMNTFMFQD